MDPRLRSWTTRTTTAEAAQTHLYKHRGEYKARTRSMKTVRSGKGTAHEQRKTPCEGRVTPCSTPPMELPSLISPGIAPGPALLTSAGALTAKIPRTAAASTPNRHFDAVPTVRFPTENGDFSLMWSAPPSEPPRKLHCGGNQTTATLHRCSSVHTRRSQDWRRSQQRSPKKAPSTRLKGLVLGDIRSRH